MVLYLVAKDGAARRFGCGCAPGLPAEGGEGPALCPGARELRERQSTALRAYEGALIERRTTEIELAILEGEERDAQRRLAEHYTEQQEAERDAKGRRRARRPPGGTTGADANPRCPAGPARG